MNKGFSYLAMLMLVAGCANVRHVAIPKVNDIGPHVVTQNKYRLAGYKVGQRDIQFGDIKDSLERNYPNVFADSGIPFTIQEIENVNFSTKYGWTFLFPYLLSIGTLPMIMHSEQDTGFVVNLDGVGNASAEYEINICMDQSFTCYTPFALLCYNDPPDTHGFRGFWRVRAYGGDSDRVIVNRSAIGYGAAVKLKELEQAGAINAAIAPKPAPATVPPTTVVPVNAPDSAEKRHPQVFELNAISL